MGQPKAWLRTYPDGEPFLARACRVLTEAGVDRVIGIIPVGTEAEAHQAGPAAILIVNRCPEKGQLTSLQLGLAASNALEIDAEAAVVLPVDVPLVKTETVRRLIDRWRDVQPAIVRPLKHDGSHGHPVIFDRSLFDELLSADHALGAKPTVRAHVTAASDVLVEDDGAFLDIDTIEDYRQAFGREP